MPAVASLITLEVAARMDLKNTENGVVTLPTGKYVAIQEGSNPGDYALYAANELGERVGHKIATVGITVHANGTAEIS